MNLITSVLLLPLSEHERLSSRRINKWEHDLRDAEGTFTCFMTNRLLLDGTDAPIRRIAYSTS